MSVLINGVTQGTSGSTYTIEDLSAQVTGSETTFTVSTAYATGSVAAYVNGVRVMSGLTELTSTTFSLSTAPYSGDKLFADYNVN